MVQLQCPPKVENCTMSPLPPLPLTMVQSHRVHESLYHPKIKKEKETANVVRFQNYVSLKQTATF